MTFTIILVVVGILIIGMAFYSDGYGNEIGNFVLGGFLGGLLGLMIGMLVGGAVGSNAVIEYYSTNKTELCITAEGVPYLSVENIDGELKYSYYVMDPDAKSCAKQTLAADGDPFIVVTKSDEEKPYMERFGNRLVTPVGRFFGYNGMQEDKVIFFIPADAELKYLTQ